MGRVVRRMADYINRDQLQNALARKKSGPANGRYTEGWNDCLMRVKSMVSAAPSVEGVAPVIRCKSCIYAKWSERDQSYYCQRRWAMHKVRERDFCSYGVRKEDTHD